MVEVVEVVEHSHCCQKLSIPLVHPLLMLCHALPGLHCTWVDLSKPYLGSPRILSSPGECNSRETFQLRQGIAALVSTFRLRGEHMRQEGNHQEAGNIEGIGKQWKH